MTITLHFIGIGTVDYEDQTGGSFLEIMLIGGGGIGDVYAESGEINTDGHLMGYNHPETRDFSMTIGLSENYTLEDDEVVVMYIKKTSGRTDALLSYVYAQDGSGVDGVDGADSGNIGSAPYATAGFLLDGGVTLAWADLGTPPALINPGAGWKQIGWFNTLLLPNKPENPSPAHPGVGVAFTSGMLSWTDGEGDGGEATSYDVYVGETLMSEGQVDTSLMIDMDWWIANFYEQAVGWHVNAINAVGTREGDTWAFDPRPQPAGYVSPMGDGVLMDATGASWADGSDGENAAAYDVYYGLGAIPSFIKTVSEEGTSLIQGNYPFYNTAYSWKVVAVNAFGVAAADIVPFRTVALECPGYTGIIDFEFPDYYPNYGQTHGGTGDDGGDGNMSPTITYRRLVVAAKDKLFYGI